LTRFNIDKTYVWDQNGKKKEQKKFAKTKNVKKDSKKPLKIRWEIKKVRMTDRNALLNIKHRLARHIIT
jgi:hypothetical protein